MEISAREGARRRGADKPSLGTWRAPASFCTWKFAELGGEERERALAASYLTDASNPFGKHRPRVGVGGAGNLLGLRECAGIYNVYNLKCVKHCSYDMLLC